MPRKTTSAKKNLPIRHENHISEDESRMIFENAIKPWMVCNWNQRDYGIDAMVEITTTIAASRSQLVTGKRFSMQLKSSRSLIFTNGITSLSVERINIDYWYYFGFGRRGEWNTRNGSRQKMILRETRVVGRMNVSALVG